MPAPNLSCFLLIVIIFEHPEKGACFGYKEAALSFPSAEEVAALQLNLATEVRLFIDVYRGELDLSE